MARPKIAVARATNVGGGQDGPPPPTSMAAVPGPDHDKGMWSMDEDAELADRFEAHRARLRSVAYHTLGLPSEADDVVQEAWLRLSRSDVGNIENLGGWLTTVVARVCLDMLQSRREQPVGIHLPESAGNDSGGIDPEQEALLADSIGPALLVILHTLTPAERLAFVLHDIFAVPFDDIAAVVGRSPTAARQLASRGRRRVPAG
jgi:RNA polymerase sigma factor (sigma-70 family)